MFSNWRFTDFSTKLNGYYLWKPWKVKKNWIEPSLIKFGLVKWNIIINNGDHMYGSVSILPFMVCYINCYGILWVVTYFAVNRNWLFFAVITFFRCQNFFSLSKLFFAVKVELIFAVSDEVECNFTLVKVTLCTSNGRSQQLLRVIPKSSNSKHKACLSDRSCKIMCIYEFWAFLARV